MFSKFAKKTFLAAAAATVLLVGTAPVQAASKDFDYNAFLKDKYGVETTTYIVGHKNPDSDTVCSAIAYAELKNKLGLPAEAIVCDSVNDETAYALQYFHIPTPRIVKDVKGLRVILVDHATYTQADNNMQDADVIEIIDHHQFGNIIPKKVITMRVMPLGSVNTIVYSLYLDNKIKPSKAAAGAMLAGILSDTRNLTKNATMLDTAAVKKLTKLSGLKDRNSFYEGMKEAAASYKGKTDKEIFYCDSKEYVMNGYKVMITCVNAKNAAALTEVAQRMQTVLPEVMQEKGLDYAFASVTCDGVDKTALVGGGAGSDELLKGAFAAPEQGIATVDRTLVRKADLVPGFTQEINKLAAGKRS